MIGRGLAAVAAILVGSPASAQYVAIPDQGRYYAETCDAFQAQKAQLDGTEQRFETAEAAAAAGFRPSTFSGCAPESYRHVDRGGRDCLLDFSGDLYYSAGEDTVRVVPITAACHWGGFASAIVRMGGDTVEVSGDSLLTTDLAGNLERPQSFYGWVTTRDRYEQRRDSIRVATDASNRAWADSARTEREARQAAAERRLTESRVIRERRIRSYRWPSAFTGAVLRRDVLIGMNGNMVIEAWGRPTAVNTTVLPNHRREQWVYENAYVYLDDGIVAAIQTYR